MPNFIIAVLGAPGIGTASVQYLKNNTQAVLKYPCSSSSSCSPYQVTFPPGYYKIELYGASGGYYANRLDLGGHGAYTSGVLNVTETSSYFIYLGQQGAMNATESYNGGGRRSSQGASGGGASDMRIRDENWNDFDSLKSRIMVAAGGSGSQDHNFPTYGGVCGYLEGYFGMAYMTPNCEKTYDVTNPSPGTQTKGGLGSVSTQDPNFGGTDGQFGIGGSPRYWKWGTGSGGGYYGGGGSGFVSCYVFSASSGSSFVSGFYGCNAIDETYSKANPLHTNQPVHYSNIKFNHALIISGDRPIPSIDDENSYTIGHVGPGFARITKVEADGSRIHECWVCEQKQCLINLGTSSSLLGAFVSSEFF